MSVFVFIKRVRVPLIAAENKKTIILFLIRITRGDENGFLLANNRKYSGYQKMRNSKQGHHPKT